MDASFKQAIVGALRSMKPGDWLYRTVKDEMTRRGHWKNKPRGKVFEKGVDPRRRGNDI